MGTPAPMRVTAGYTQDMSFQPLGMVGQPDPIFYSTFVDDFMAYEAGDYTVTANTNGTVAAVAGDGGQIIFTTNSSTPLAADIAALQTPVANVTLSQTNKIAFGCRLQVSSASNAAFNVGLIQTTTTPFTVTDGVYFGKATGSTAISLYVVSGSSVQASTSLSGIVTPADATFLDLAYTFNGRGEILVYAGTDLYGQKQNQDTATLGPVARIDVSALTLTTAVLAPSLALKSGTASSKTMTVDFFYAMKER